MAAIPAQVAVSETVRQLQEAGLAWYAQGKVRDTFEYPGRPDLLLQVGSDRISIFDMVLPGLVPFKGEVLTALTYFWLTQVLSHLPHHLAVAEQNPFLNAAHDLKAMVAMLPLERCLVVKKVRIIPYEMIFRHHLGGSVWREYEKTGMVAGQELSPGLHRWHTLVVPLFTPSTKAEQGHDRNITVDEYFQAVGRLAGEFAVNMLKGAYLKAYHYARERGILILDTKFEVGYREFELMIADEVFTPDSSRFTTREDFVAASREGRDPVFYDKEFVRKWGRQVQTPWGIGLQNLDPLNEEHLKFVASLPVPDDVIAATTDRYLDIFQRLTGIELQDFQREFMGIQ